VQASQKILNQIKRLEETKDRDRLALVSSMRYLLSVLQRSLSGWIQWINTPPVMARFTKEDMEKMHGSLSEFARSFVEYDIEATNIGKQRGLKAIKKVTKKKRERTETDYVA
jgi:hypothetical protein